MLRYIGISILIFAFTQNVFSQEVSGFHDVQPGNEPNEYTIKTTVKGLAGVDIARIKYIIDNKHTYKASPSNGLFSDRNESYIKFYIMAVPASGELTIELGIVAADGGDYAFPVEFQFSRNEEKENINLPQISISGGGAIASVEIPEPEAEEIPEAIEAPEVEEVPVPEAEEEPTEPIVETPDPVVLPVVEEEVIEAVEETPEPAVEEPEEIETPEPVAPPVEEESETTPEPVVETPPAVEEKPEVVIETPAPIAEEVPEPVVESTPEVVEVPEPVASAIESTPPPVEVTRSSKKYTIQLLSLSKFSQSRLNYYIKEHGLTASKVHKKQSGDWMKITYGELNSIEEAKELRSKLMRDNDINDSFVTQIK